MFTHYGILVRNNEGLDNASLNLDGFNLMEF